MRRFRGVATAVLGLAPVASGQRFGFTHQMLPADSDATQAIALGDVDGDGDLDLFVGNGVTLPMQNRLYLDDGTGFFTDVSGTNLPAVPDRTAAIVLGDVDGDGDLDVFVGNGASVPEQSRLHLNDGTGVFSDVTATSLPALIHPTAALALGDVDGDGDLDVFLGNGTFNAAQNLLYLNDGTGVFADATATSLPALLDKTMAVALGDVDGDGDLDAFVGNGACCAGEQNRLYLNSGTGTFTDVTASNLPASSDPTRAVALGDVDGDGDLDVFVGNGASTSPQDRLYLNDGVGLFSDATATNLPPLSGNTTAVVLGDVDGDGDLDALSATDGGDRLYLNSGTGVFTDVTTSLPSAFDPTSAVAMGDVDGDGDLDLALGKGSAVGRQNRLYLNGGAGIFEDVTTIDLPDEVDDTTSIALGDIDADGDLDALVGKATDVAQQNRVYRNNGTGGFSDVTSTSLSPVLDHTWAVALADVDGDGDLDAFVGNGGLIERQNRLLLNVGTGTFVDVTATHVPAFLDATRSIALGDVDGDGDPDVLIGNLGQNRLYVNLGSGVFADVTATNLPVLVDDTRAVALGDVDGDGDLDAYVGKATGVLGGAQNRLYQNDGTGVFVDVTATQLPVLLDATRDVALGDIDGDGDLDLFVANAYQQNRLYRNTGGGSFVDVTATHLPSLIATTEAVAFGDLDQDGDLDVILGQFSPPNRVYLNDGTGVFTDTTPTNLLALSDYAQALALGDLDGDGDLDAFVGNDSQRDRLYTNLTRQLAWRGIPRVGKPLTLDLYGPTWGAWFLAFSTGTSSIAVPPLGTLRLDPASLHQVFASLLDASGRASITFHVPTSAALVGATVYLQAVVAGPARFTNLEITTLTNL